MNDALISIIVPTYRKIDDIYITLDSIFEQKNVNIELVISDDGSENFDEFRLLVEEYIINNKRKHILSYQIQSLAENGGTVKNLNSALSLITGQYVKFIAPGDYFSSSASLFFLVQSLVNKQGLLIAAKIRRYDEKTKELLDEMPPKKNLLAFGKMTSKQQFKVLRQGVFAVAAPSVLFRTEIFGQYGKFDESFKYVEDLPYWLQLTSKGVKIHCVDKEVVRYATGGMSGNGFQPFFEETDRIFTNYSFEIDSPERGILRTLMKRWVKYRTEQRGLKEKDKIKALILRFKYFDVSFFLLWRKLKIFIWRIK